MWTRKRRILVGAVAALLAAIFVVLSLSAVAASEEARRQAAGRRSKKVHIGDDRATVRRRIGVPDTVYSSERGYVWVWLTQDKTDYRWAVVFDSLSERVKNVWAMSEQPWYPEDALSFGRFEFLTVDSIRAVLGPPCAAEFDEDSVRLYHYFPLHSAEIREDSAYRSNPSRVLRVFVEDLRGERRITAAGWQGADRVCKNR